MLQFGIPGFDRREKLLDKNFADLYFSHSNFRTAWEFIAKDTEEAVQTLILIFLSFMKSMIASDFFNVKKVLMKILYFVIILSMLSNKCSQIHFFSSYNLKLILVKIKQIHNKIF